MNELIIVGDRVLISPDEGEKQTESGLVLPASVAEKERVRSGRVEKVGPGYVMPNPDYTAEPWSSDRESVRYLPLQARPGDFAFFLQKEAIDIKFEGKAFVIVNHAAILALVRRHREDLPNDVEGIDIEDLLN